MKKSFLFILPALMVLSACNVSPKEVNNKMVEDTLAHEEIFGDAGEAINLNVKRADDEPGAKSANPLTTPLVGVQYRKQDDGKYAIRYVAAIADYNVEAVWTRDICEPNGSRRNTSKMHFPCEKAYTALAAGDGVDVPSTAGDEYNYFVIYTLKDIPSTDVDSYLFAYLTITYNEQSVKSLARISRVGGGDTFTMNTASRHGYFLHGNIGDEEFVDVDDNGGNDNWVQETGIEMNAEDEFGLFKYEPGEGEHFQHFGNYGSDSYNFFRNNNKGKQKIYHNGTYNIYLSKKNDTMNVVYLNGTVSAERIYLDAVHWDPSGCRLAVYAFKEWYEGDVRHTANDAWFNMNATGDSNVYYIDIDVSLQNTVIFCRMDKNKENGWGSNEDKRVYNQSYDLGLPATNTLNRKYYITGWENDGGKCPGEWHSVD